MSGKIETEGKMGGGEESCNYEQYPPCMKLWLTLVLLHLYLYGVTINSTHLASNYGLHWYYYTYTYTVIITVPYTGYRMSYTGYRMPGNSNGRIYWFVLFIRTARAMFVDVFEKTGIGENNYGWPCSTYIKRNDMDCIIDTCTYETTEYYQSRMKCLSQIYELKFFVLLQKIFVPHVYSFQLRLKWAYRSNLMIKVNTLFVFSPTNIYLFIESYHLLEGFQSLSIVASNDINENILLALNREGHEITTFGIGTVSTLQTRTHTHTHTHTLSLSFFILILRFFPNLLYYLKFYNHLILQLNHITNLFFLSV